jgi:general stress protein 26
MGDNTRTKIVDYLSAHLYINLATVSPDGSPVAHTVGFVNDGPVVYFMTDNKSRKSRNIGNNSRVAFTCDEDYTDFFLIQGVQAKGFAEVVTDRAVIEGIVGGMMKKFPQVKDLPENPDYIFYRILPEEGVFIDNTQGFGHREETTF